MAQFLILLLSLYQLQASAQGEILDASPRYPSPNAIADHDDDLSALLPPELDGLFAAGRKQQDNSQDEDDLNWEDDGDLLPIDIPIVKTDRDQTELKFGQPLAGMNIDYSKNGIVVKFRKERPVGKHRAKPDPEEEAKRRSFENNFMRFGRAAASRDFMRFGKRDSEQLPTANSIDHGFYNKEPRERPERSYEGMRDSRGDNFMRFGRSSQDFMRFGRSPADFMRFGRSPADFMRFGRSPADFMRFGRSPADFMRFGRSPADFMRFGRSPADFMRFGRSPSDFMRLGRGGGSNDFMRFGRSPGDFMRFGRAENAPRQMDRNFMRFGRPDNFMRFGRSNSPDEVDKWANFMRFGRMDPNFMGFGKSAEREPGSGNNTKEEAAAQKSQLKQIAAQLLEGRDKDSDDEGNPMDKAIKVLYSKHQQQQKQQQQQQQRAFGGDVNRVEPDADLEAETEADDDYVLNLVKK